MEKSLLDHDLANQDISRATSFNYLKTFNHMTHRRLLRRYKGTYVHYSAFHQFSVILVITFSLGLWGFGASQVDDGEQTKFSLSTVSLVVIVGLFCFLGILIKIALVIRWMFYWLVLATIFAYAVTESPSALFAKPSGLTDSEANQRMIVIYLFITIECITFAVYLITHIIYPWMVSSGHINSNWWWQIKIASQASPNRLTYRSRAWCGTKKHSTMSYCGGLDENCHPHGYGIWTDTSFHGERLEGLWEHGIPVGPFRSREYGSGYSFMNQRIAYVHNRIETDWTKSNFLPSHSQSGLIWGVASIESSVSGAFFKYLPNVQHIALPSTNKNVEWCLSFMQRNISNVIHRVNRTINITNDESRGLLVSGFEPISTEARGVDEVSIRVNHVAHEHPSTGNIEKSYFQVKGWQSRWNGAVEALIFIPGFNCPVQYALKRFGQLLALGDFPTTIFPIVFGWPAGSPLTYFQAKTVGAESDQTRKDFIALLKSLQEAGFEVINIIAHSMGARVLMNVIFDSSLHDLLQTSQNIHAMTLEEEKMKLSTVILLNPDYERDLFVQKDGGYDHIYQFCNHISIYGDRTDGALWYVEALAAVQGKSADSLGRSTHRIYRDIIDPIDEKMSFYDSKSSKYKDLGAYTSHINGLLQLPEVASIAYEYDQDFNIMEMEKDYLDVDVLDTTWMDNNVHSMRHNYFNINPTLVDDLRELVVNKTRAYDRHGIMNTQGNSYIFLVAPSHITND